MGVGVAVVGPRMPSRATLALSIMRTSHGAVPRRAALGNPQGNAGTKRVRQLGHERVRASTPKVVKQPDSRQERPRECPCVDARPLLVFPS
jgi:hypothetical protein